MLFRSSGQVLRDRWASIEHMTGYLTYATGGFPELHPGIVDERVPVLSATLDTAAWMRPGYRWDPGMIQRIAPATAKAGVWNCPTLWIWMDESMQGLYPFGEPSPGSIPDSLQRGWWLRWGELAARTVSALQQAGAGILLGTDGSAGERIAEELQVLVKKGGLTTYQALAAGTRNAAAFTGTLDSTGTVAVNKRADLLLLNDNPLQDVTAVTSLAGVMVIGRWLTKIELAAARSGP